MPSARPAIVADGPALAPLPEHDFPQRIVYERRGPDALVTRVSGVSGGAPKSFDQTWARASTP